MNNDAEFADLDNLSVSKLDKIQKTLSAVLASSHAVDAYAQIIDGNPTRTSYTRNYGSVRDQSTLSERTEPSPESVQLYNKIRLLHNARDQKIDMTVRIFLA